MENDLYKTVVTLGNYFGQRFLERQEKEVDWTRWETAVQSLKKNWNRWEEKQDFPGENPFSWGVWWRRRIDSGAEAPEEAHELARQSQFIFPEDWEGDGVEAIWSRTQRELGVRLIVSEEPECHKLKYESAVTIGDGNVTIIFDQVRVEKYNNATPWKELQRVVIHPSVAKKVRDDFLEHRLMEAVKHHLAGPVCYVERRF